MKLPTSHLNQYDSLDEIQTAVLRQLLNDGEHVSPRGIPTIENRAVSLTLTNPRRRCILNPARRWSLPLALAELCWHLSGSKRADALTHYAPTWTANADENGEIRGSCYGAKIFKSPMGPTPWERTRELLKAEASTRRAVLYTNDRTAHLDPLCSDAACATSLQFLLRKGALDAVVTMRSNDAMLGLPYDIFLFSFLQELMAVELGVSLGSYHHFAASLHLYEKHRSRAIQIVAWCGAHSVFSMPPLEDPSGRRLLIEFESRTRAGQNVDSTSEGVCRYWRDLAEVLSVYRASRENGWRRALQGLSSIYRPVLEPLAT
jgi:thymidylate synthase